MTDRLTRLRALAAARPQDPFAAYSLAMEERKHDLALARATFERVRRDFPTYLPTCYQLGKLLIELGEREAARAVRALPAAQLALAQKSRVQEAPGELQLAQLAIAERGVEQSSLGSRATGTGRVATRVPAR